jgi:hypothetical protein
MMRVLSLIGFAIAWAALGSGVGERARADDQAWGTIRGQVVFDGDQIPERKQADVNGHKDQEHCLSKGPIFSEAWVVNPKNKGVRWVFVWLAPADKNRKLPVHPALKAGADKPVEIDQPCCAFVPHAVGVQQGQLLISKNSAPVAHNVNWNGGSKNPGNNLLVPAGSEIKIKDLRASPFPIKFECNIHRWMNGWVRVFDHPYFAVTDADGKFEIKDAPVGDWRLMIWQESTGYLGGAAGRNGSPVTVKAGPPTDLGQFKLKPTD